MIPCSKKLLRYALSSTIAVSLLLWLLSGTSFKKWTSVFQAGQLEWIIVAVTCLLLGFWIRAYRWRLLLQEVGTSLRTSQSFWILMVGYLVNFTFPRAGELFRAGLLKKKYRISLAKSLATVIYERILDLLVALAFVGISLLLEYEQLRSYLRVAYSKLSYWQVLLYLIVAAVLTATLYVLLRRYYGTYLVKLQDFLARLWRSIYSIHQIRSPFRLCVSTLLIWSSYYLSNYFFMQAYAETEDLPLQAGVLLIATSSLGMILPVPGGIGTFHTFAQKTFMWYGVEKAAALAVAFAIHFGFTAAVIVFGGVGLLLCTSPKEKK